ncbi:MAG: hypothetical protein JXA13_06050 [Anaerolineales bacterium]|nr:hypothetical protein [Anaerolineales bacterium]
MYKGQFIHLLLLALLLAAVAWLAGGEVLDGQLWGVGTPVWFWTAILVPVLHQVVVLLVWRGQLYHHWMTNRFGKRGFLVYKIVFTILFAARPLSIVLLGISNRGTLGVYPYLAYGLAVTLLIPAVYTLYSVVRCFGMDRAYGADHFEPELYRSQPFIRQGMFRHSDNAMYKFAFLLLWSLGLVFLSKAALLAALFNHLYIWVHYYFTELPDIRFIYGSQAE